MGGGVWGPPNFFVGEGEGGGRGGKKQEEGEDAKYPKEEMQADTIFHCTCLGSWNILMRSKHINSIYGQIFFGYSIQQNLIIKMLWWTSEVQGEPVNYWRGQVSQTYKALHSSK